MSLSFLTAERTTRADCNGCGGLRFLPTQYGGTVTFPELYPLGMSGDELSYLANRLKIARVDTDAKVEAGGLDVSLNSIDLVRIDGATAITDVLADTAAATLGFSDPTLSAAEALLQMFLFRGTNPPQVWNQAGVWFPSIELSGYLLLDAGGGDHANLNFSTSDQLGYLNTMNADFFGTPLPIFFDSDTAGDGVITFTQLDFSQVSTWTY